MAIMNEVEVAKLRKDIEMVIEWRKSGKPLTKEQEYFAKQLSDKMIELRTQNQVGVQIVSKSHINYIKGMQPIQGSDAVGGITQDVVSGGPAASGKFPKKYPKLEQTEMKPADEEEEVVDEEAEAGMKNAKLNGVSKIAKPSGEKPDEVPIAETQDGQFPKKSPDAQNIKLNPPAGQEEGRPNIVADSIAEVTPKNEEGKSTEDVGTEMIGHNPDAPMPQKTAEELIENAKWGVEIGAYVDVREGIERQLGRKDYAEFVDTPEKLKSVIEYLAGLVKEQE